MRGGRRAATRCDWEKLQTCTKYNNSAVTVPEAAGLLCISVAELLAVHQYTLLCSTLTAVMSCMVQAAMKQAVMNGVAMNARGQFFEDFSRAFVIARRSSTTGSVVLVMQQLAAKAGVTAHTMATVCYPSGYPVAGGFRPA